MTLLAARDLAVVPPGASRPAVRDVSLAVGRGECLAIAGPNGSGKTSLLLALAGLWPAAAGRIELLGRPFGPGADPDLARRVATVLQDPSAQILHGSVREELAFGARNLGVHETTIRDRIDRWVSAFGLERELAREPAHLSAGQQQLVMLAAALVMAPDVLLADEPTAHLDSEAKRRVRALLDRERAGGLATIWVTQDEAELAAADRAVLLGAERPAGATARVVERDTEAAPALWLAVRARDAETGPRVETRVPLEIAIGARGVTALLGANGVGKSVLLAAAAGVVTLDQVTVRWVAPAETKPILTLQFPELQIFEEQVADELAFAGVSRGVPRVRVLDQAAAMLDELGFDAAEMLSAKVWNLSTGEKRLVEVVAALVAPASLLLLDEPTAGIDPARRAALARLVAARARIGPVLIATQDLDWSQRLPARACRIGDIEGRERATARAEGEPRR